MCGCGVCGACVVCCVCDVCSVCVRERSTLSLEHTYMIHYFMDHTLL